MNLVTEVATAHNNSIYSERKLFSQMLFTTSFYSPICSLNDVCNRNVALCMKID